MVESLVLAVDVGQEMLRPFRQVQDGLQVDVSVLASATVGKLRASSVR